MIDFPDNVYNNGASSIRLPSVCALNLWSFSKKNVKNKTKQENEWLCILFALEKSARNNNLFTLNEGLVPKPT